MGQRRPMVARGERAPDFVARRGPDGRPTRFYAYAGGAATLVVFSGGAGAAAARTACDAIDAVPGGPGAPTPVHAVVASSDDVGDAAYADPQGMVHAAYGLDADGPPVVLVLDPNLRVAGHVEAPAGAVDVGRVRSIVDDVVPPDEGRTVHRQAPVLFVPDALSADLCDELMTRWAAADTVETGVEASVDGGRVEVGDDRRKRRRDLTVTDPQLQRTLATHIGRRVMSEIRKAFVSEASRFEGFKVGCYDADDAGFFTAHRDNLSPSTAHRRFGLTVNLNDDYDGGELRFPEYGADRYRPEAGAALVFSGAHLHEVLPVRRGRRFVLLSFLFADGAASAS